MASLSLVAVWSSDEVRDSQGKGGLRGIFSKSRGGAYSRGNSYTAGPCPPSNTPP